MEEKIRINVDYSPLAEPIENQMNKQGFTLGDNKTRIHKLDKSLKMCMFHLMTDSEHKKFMKKLHKKVMESIEPLEINKE
ncbi:hypothetical protein J416_09429 [Gracilibacillus halophilus YIM-C55.5]|uniref:Uncharacterized protein n=1 Tax=Gracilibacillus halophilus YIM-C55.5 TaxID=1308866 RepID=N4W8T2_9BACI|nr:hypothetical protein [Gracilibacillus halophilus]ENH96708.1 hypothetical protein J416_09429 [Gracilibacillus halophilus YIM-C55.5]